MSSVAEFQYIMEITCQLRAWHLAKYWNLSQIPLSFLHNMLTYVLSQAKLFKILYFDYLLNKFPWVGGPELEYHCGWLGHSDDCDSAY